MSVFDILPWRSSEDDDGRPPKPDGESDEFTRELTRNHVTIEYRNGDKEEFEAFNVYSRDADEITFNVDVNGPRVSLRDSVSLDYERRTLNFELLAREPIIEELGTVEYRVSWETEYEWKVPRFGWDREWVETVDRDSLEMEVSE